MRAMITNRFFVSRWRSGQMTNFQYLTELNKMAGRSFNDLMQYPVFPFVLSDFDSEVLDLNDFKKFRLVTSDLVTFFLLFGLIVSLKLFLFVSAFNILPYAAVTHHLTAFFTESLMIVYCPC